MKIINIILGLATAIILSSLILLGIKAFHPEPAQPDYFAYPKAAPYREFNCAKGDTKCTSDQNAFYAEQQKQQDEFQKRQKEYQDKMNVYNRDVFVAANIVGVLVFIGGFLLLFRAAIASQSVPIGIMLAGLYGIIYGYFRGWGSVDDRLKFFIGLLVAIVTIGGSMWLMQKYYKKGESKNRTDAR